MSVSNTPELVHAALEAWPLSSSWHVEYFFGIKEQDLQLWHTHLLPAYLLIGMFFCWRKKFFCLQSLFLGLAPAGLCYFALKTPLLSAIVFDDLYLHLCAATILLLGFFCVSDDTSNSSSNIKSLIIWVGICQTLSLLLPGISRLACSTLALIFVRSTLFDLVLASFTLQAAQTLLYSLYYSPKVLTALPSYSIIALEQVIFLSSLALFCILGRKALALCATYRIFWVWFL